MADLDFTEDEDDVDERIENSEEADPLLRTEKHDDVLPLGSGHGGLVGDTDNVNERELIKSAKFAATDRPTGMSFTQAGAGIIVIAGLLFSASRYYNRDNKSLHSERKQG